MAINIHSVTDRTGFGAIPTSQEAASYVAIVFVLFMGGIGMVFRLSFVVTSLCIVIGLSTSATYASEDKSRLFPLFRYSQ
ncbi:hypothetical protein E1189_00380 [Sansalvadorimonas verongulae]|nr:hypothetical protein [Sansalvadorimonas verongulae]